MAQHHDAIVARLILVCREGASQDRLDAHDVEVVCRDARADDAFGRRLVGQVEVRVVQRREPMFVST